MSQLLLLATRVKRLLGACPVSLKQFPSGLSGEMLVTTHCLVVVAVFGSLILGGYGVAARLTDLAPGERLATAILAGLAVLIWNISVLGFIHPLSGPWVWICLWPIATTVFSRRTLGTMRSDFRTIIANPKGRVAAVSFGLFMLMLLWPLFAHPKLIFFDGTSNHDAFFWISGAEFLRDHTYMVAPVKSAFQPLNNGVGVFTDGWTPLWGRMSAEGLVAMVSTLTGVPTIQLYVAATVALFLPWVAAVYLVAKTFLIEKFSYGALVALCATQPLFVFFQANANLPNLLGCLNGALLVIAIARSLRGPAIFSCWHGLAALSLHGLLCSYPEMAPFVLLSVALIWSRSWLLKRPSPPTWGAVVAGLVGLALNPATTVRAFSGFYRSFHAANGDPIWPKLFEKLSAAEYLPALATLTLHTVDDTGVWIAGLCSLGLLTGLIIVLRSATDRFGAWATLSGPGVLLAYTVLTHFSYGWQKVAQFGGVFLAAMIPVAAVNLASTPAARQRFFAGAAALAALMLFFGYATGRNIYESHKWSHRKSIGDDWLTIRDYAHENLKHATVRIDGPSFSAPYFYGMWSLYALVDSHPLFSRRESENAGYVHDYTRNERDFPNEIPSAYFVSSQWADSFDANSPRLMMGSTAALLTKSNRVETLQGFSPKFGVPELASSHLVIGLTPHDSGTLQFTLTPHHEFATRPVKWQVSITVDGRPSKLSDLPIAPPWLFTLPLIPTTLNQIEIIAEDGSDSTAFPYAVTDLRVTSTPGGK